MHSNGKVIWVKALSFMLEAFYDNINKFVKIPHEAKSVCRTLDLIL